MDQRDGLDVLEKANISWSCQELNHDSFVQPMVTILTILSWLLYSTVLAFILLTKCAEFGKFSYILCLLKACLLKYGVYILGSLFCFWSAESKTCVGC